MADLNDINNEIDRIENAKGEIADAIRETGVEVPENARLGAYPPLIRRIPETLKEIFWATYGVTTAEEIEQALTDGKLPILIDGDLCFPYSGQNNTLIAFGGIYAGNLRSYTLTKATNGWGRQYNYTPQSTANKVNEVNENSDNNHYPSAKAVYDAIVAGKQVFWATYGTTTAQEIDDAIAAGKQVFILDTNLVYTCAGKDSGYYYFFGLTGNISYRRIQLRISNNGWARHDLGIEKTANKISDITGNETDETKYPNAKCLYDAIVANKQIFWATYGTTTAAEIDAAVAAGKAVMCRYNNQDYLVAHYDSASNSIWFGGVYLTNLIYLRLMRSNNAWSAGVSGVQVAIDRVNTISGNETSTSKYPSTKAVADALGKMGVVSQTQTWTGSPNTGYEYTMLNIARGIIPQYFIDIVESAGALFNATTGYFELNGLTDISYEEMRIIYNMRRPQNIGDLMYGCSNEKLRTNFVLFDEATKTWNRYGNIGNIPSIVLTSVAYGSQSLSVFNFAPDASNNLSNYGSIVSLSYAFGNCRGLKKIIGRICLNYIPSVSYLAEAFRNCHSLEDVKLNKLKYNISIEFSPNLSLASVVYMVDNATNGNTAITITLHATAYARCQADTTEYTYNEQTYTGIIAYAAAKNITIQSA